MGHYTGERLANIIAANKRRTGIPHTEEHKAKIKAAANSSEILEHNRQTHLGKPSTFKGKKHSDEAKAKQRAAKLGKVLSEDTKRKIGSSIRSLGDDWRAQLRQRPVYDPLPLTEDARARIVAANKRRTGIPHTDEHKTKIRSAMQTEESRKRSALGAAKQMAQPRKPRTILEEQLAKYLKASGYNFEEQRRFGRYVVDAYLPEYNAVFEADGVHWHQDKERQARRDAYLMAHGIKAIVHLPETDLRMLTP